MANGGGFIDSLGSVTSGSPRMLQMMRKHSGRVAVTGLTLSATGLYFHFVKMSTVCTFVELRGNVEMFLVMRMRVVAFSV